MRRNPLVYWGVVSLGLHLLVIAALLVSGTMGHRKPTVFKVSYLELSQQWGPEKQQGNAALTVVKRSSLKPKKSARKTRPVPQKKTEAKRSLSSKVLVVSPQKLPEPPKNIRQKPPSAPATTKPSPEAKHAPATSEVPDNNTDETPVVLVTSPGQERQAYRLFPEDKSGGDAGLPSMAKTEESVASPAGSPIGTALLGATPIFSENSPPTYPRSARRQGWEGEVWLRVRVAVTGQVLKVRIERSSGHSILDRAALEAVRHWRFRPGRLGTKPVAVDVRVPVCFELRDP
ncbi:MAG: energy transducer TonB [Desulfuromonadales bacterium]|nr:energy transducer TonB [Desulfuromonadales bacterium]